MSEKVTAMLKDRGERENYELLSLDILDKLYKGFEPGEDDTVKETTVEEAGALFDERFPKLVLDYRDERVADRLTSSARLTNEDIERVLETIRDVLKSWLYDYDEDILNGKYSELEKQIRIYGEVQHVHGFNTGYREGFNAGSVFRQSDNADIRQEARSFGLCNDDDNDD